MIIHTENCVPDIAQILLFFFFFKYTHDTVVMCIYTLQKCQWLTDGNSFHAHDTS